MLPLAQFAYNSVKHDIIGVLPFFANYKHEPSTGNLIKKLKFTVKTVEEKVKLIYNIQIIIKQEIKLA